MQKLAQELPLINFLMDSLRIKIRDPYFFCNACGSFIIHYIYSVIVLNCWDMGKRRCGITHQNFCLCPYVHSVFHNVITTLGKLGVMSILIKLPRFTKMLHTQFLLKTTGLDLNCKGKHLYKKVINKFWQMLAVAWAKSNLLLWRKECVQLLPKLYLSCGVFDRVWQM